MSKNKLKKSLEGKIIYKNASLKAKPAGVDKKRAKATNGGDRTTFVLISKDNACERYDWLEDEVYIEELDVKGAKFHRLKTFFKDHRTSVDTAIGRIENLRIEDDELLGDVIFGKDKESQIIKQKYDDEILTDVSIGYRIDEFILTEKKGKPNEVLVTDFEILELSAVWKGADAGASKVKSATQKPQEKRFSFDLYKKKLKRTEQWI